MKPIFTILFAAMTFAASAQTDSLQAVQELKSEIEILKN